MEVYVVTEFGCNSTPSDMYPPTTWVFTDREKAYQCYHDHAPSLTDMDNEAEQIMLKSGECIIQLCGYPSEPCRAKRPYGVSITKEKIM